MRPETAHPAPKYLCWEDQFNLELAARSHPCVHPTQTRAPSHSDGATAVFTGGRISENLLAFYLAVEKGNG